jgi:hypothetical protein
MLTATVRVTDVHPDPLRRDLLRRWLVTVDVLEVHGGTLPSGHGQFSLLVHSPSRDFRDPDILGNSYVMTLPGSVTTSPGEPYDGEFSIAPASHSESP